MTMTITTTTRLPDDVPSPDAAAMAQESNQRDCKEASATATVLPVVVHHSNSSASVNKTITKSTKLDANRRPLVPASETVPPQVQWEPEHREWHDKLWGLLYVLALIAFLACGFTLVAKSQDRWEFVTSVAPSSNETVGLQTVRIVSPYFQESVQQCCASKPVTSVTDDQFGNIVTYYDLCSMLTVEDATRRRRFLQENATENDDAWFLPPQSNSKLEPGDGMFDAFSEAPGIPVTLCLIALACALLWVVLLRFFATPIVFVTEAVKVAFFLYLFVMGIQNGATEAAIVSVVCALLVVAWDIYTRRQLTFAGKMLSHAARSFQDNMAMFCAFIPILAMYAVNAYLFVLFYAKSFNVVEVQQVTECYMTTNYNSMMTTAEQCTTTCIYQSPSYTTGMVIYISLAYLWSVLLFSTMRLSIIATVIGSWHFHPHEKPTIARAIINTCTTSLGTLSIASLIMTIAEKLNRMFLQKTMWSQCWNPIFWVIMPLYCLLGACCRMLIMMLTKFSVILHVFTGKSWLGSAKKVFKILKRHFKDGLVTEYASTNVLNLGSYVFSIAIYFIAWVWLDQEFQTDTFINVNDKTLMIVVWLFFALFNIWYPVLGLYLIIVLNRFLSKWEDLDPALWVVPFAATFVGCIAMMFFTYLAGIFLDTVDVLFLCFAIDRDNDVDLANDEFATLVSSGESFSTVLATPDLQDVVIDGDDEERPLPTVVLTGLEPVHAASNTTK